MREVSRRAQQLEHELNTERQRTRALAGLEPPAPGRRLPQGVSQADVDRAREELLLVYPELQTMQEQQAAFQEQQRQLQEFQAHHWRNLGAQTVRTLESTMKEQIGDLSPKGKQALVATFFHRLQTDEQFFNRYENGDPQLVSDFIGEYKSELLDPYHTRRSTSATATITAARSLPRGGNTSAIAPAARSAEALDPADEDAVHKRAFRRFQARKAAA